MGKSPGKWIKAVLFGKKSSKSSLSKEVKILRSASEKATLVSAKELESTLSVEPPLVSHQNPSADAVIKDKLDSENGTVGADLPDEVVNSSSTRPSGDVDSMTKLGVPDDNERIRLEEAATKAQAAFRGYLARRAFRALKGIIRLQAVIRGHLVRRQAAATLYCIKGIIRLQALVRGRKVRHSDIGNKVRNNTSVGKLDAKCLDSSKTNGSSSWVEKKLLKNVFARKLKSSLPSAKPLQLQYNPEEQNSAWEWLQRWTISYVETKTPLSEPKNMSQKNEPRPKRGVRSVPNRKPENGSVHSVSEKPKTKAKANPRKVSNVVTEKLKQESEEPCLETELAGDEFLHCDQSFSRRGSLPAKYDDQENVVHNSPRLPSYMATTKSAKAKLKDHASSRFGVEKAEKNSLTRRHSLPSSSTGGGKMSSSPRVQRLVQASGKGGMKFDKSLSSSRDGNEKPVQAEWRR